MDARQLPARHGALWLLAGFALFRRHPPLMTALTFGYLLTVVFRAEPGAEDRPLPIAADAADPDRDAGQRLPRHRARPALCQRTLIAGISEQRVGLIRLGGLHLVGSSLLDHGRRSRRWANRSTSATA
jgi:hypothetical protein